MDFDAQFKISVTPDIAGERLDSVVAKSVSGCSRSLARQLIKEGKIALKGGLRKPGYKVKSGETIIGVIPNLRINKICMWSLPQIMIILVGTSK